MAAQLVARKQALELVLKIESMATAHAQVLYARDAEVSKFENLPVGLQIMVPDVECERC